MDIGNNNVIVTAHPDDEVLWASSLPLKYPERNWTVICCSVPRLDPIRAWKFFDACDVLGVSPRLIPSQETPPDQDLVHLDILDLSGYDLIVTHNAYGEYGHRHHRNVHEYITSRYDNVMTFGYAKGKLGKIHHKLTPFEYQIKLKALKQYNHIFPYRGESIPKWEALIHRYADVEGLDFSLETFDEPAR